MKYIIKLHAKKRMKERLIPEALIYRAIEYPDKIGYDDKGRWLVKKIYKKNGKERLLLVACETVGNVVEIITVN